MRAMIRCRPSPSKPSDEHRVGRLGRVPVAEVGGVEHVAQLARPVLAARPGKHDVTDQHVVVAPDHAQHDRLPGSSNVDRAAEIRSLTWSSVRGLYGM